MKKILKKVYFKLFCGNSIVRKGVKLGKGSYIREHCNITGGKNIVIGEKTRISPYSRLNCFTYISNEKLHPKLTIGNNCFIGRNSTILCANDIQIGDNVMMASYIFISDESHGMDLSSNLPFEKQKLIVSKVIIENNVWIGEKVIILPGVCIGKNSIIGAGSVVTKSIPSFSIAVGNPARVIKKWNFDKNCWENA